MKSLTLFAFLVAINLISVCRGEEDYAFESVDVEESRRIDRSNHESEEDLTKLRGQQGDDRERRKLSSSSESAEGTRGRYGRGNKLPHADGLSPTHGENIESYEKHRAKPRHSRHHHHHHHHHHHP